MQSYSNISIYLSMKINQVNMNVSKSGIAMTSNGNVTESNSTDN